MKKTFAVLLVLLMLLSIIGCGEKKPSSSQFGIDLSSSIEEEIADMMGYNCLIYYCPGSYFDSDSLFWYKNGTLYRDMAANRLTEIENNHNCNISVDYFSDTTKLTQTLTSTVASGVDGASIVVTSYYEPILTLAESEILLPLDDYEDYINIHDEAVYGPANILEPGLYKGHPFMAIPYTHPERQLTPDRFLIFNEVLTDAYEVEDLRAVNEQKKWTWDYFEQFLDDYTVTEDGKVSIYGYASTYLGGMALVSNGFQLAVKDESGNIVSGLDSPVVVETIEWIQKLRNEHPNKINYVESYSTGVEMLIKGQAFIASTELYYMTATVQYNLEKYGILPFPYGPSCEYGKAGGDPEIYGGAVSVTAEQPEFGAAIMNAYCQPFEEYPTAEDALSLYSSIYFDSRDIAVLDNLTRYSRYYYWGANGVNLLNTEIKNNGSKKSAAEIIASVEGKLDEAIEKYVIPNLEFTEQYFTK